MSRDGVETDGETQNSGTGNKDPICELRQNFNNMMGWLGNLLTQAECTAHHFTPDAAKQ